VAERDRRSPEASGRDAAPIIEAEGLTKHFGPIAAVDGVSLRVECGEVVGLLGPNGAGKTTLMRILAGYLPASTGRARIAGFDVFDESLEARRRIGYLSENTPLDPWMRAAEFLSWRAAIYAIPRRERAAAIARACAATGFEPGRRRQLISTLSRGYRQRLALAACLLHEPELLILDEPSEGLDPNQIRQMRLTVRALAPEHTVLFSTHILPEVEAVASRVLIIHRGRLVPEEELADLSRPRGLIVVVRGPPERVRNVLGDVAGVARVVPGHVEAEREEHEERSGAEAALDAVASAEPAVRYEVMVEEPGRDLREAVFRRVAEAGFALLELREATASLEDVFVRATASDAAARSG